MLHQTGQGIGREHACSQGQICVDDCCELSEAGVSDGWVKTGPEHPQKDRSCRWELLIYPKHAHYIILFVFRLLYVHEVDTGEVIVVLAMQMLRIQVCPLDGRSHTWTATETAVLLGIKTCSTVLFCFFFSCPQMIKLVRKFKSWWNHGIFSLSSSSQLLLCKSEDKTPHMCTYTIHLTSHGFYALTASYQS